MRGAEGTAKSKGLEYVNVVRKRAGVEAWDMALFTPENLLAERSRELYWELTRRTDLVRFNKYTGADQMLWAWKGNDVNGNEISARYNVMPVPTNVLASNPGFTQNPGY